MKNHVSVHLTVFAIGQRLYNLLVCVNFTCGQRNMWADREVEGRPIVPEEFPNHLVTQMETLAISLAIIMCKEFN